MRGQRHKFVSVGLQMTFKALRSDELIKGESLDYKEKKKMHLILSSRVSGHKNTFFFHGFRKETSCQGHKTNLIKVKTCFLSSII